MQNRDLPSEENPDECLLSGKFTLMDPIFINKTFRNMSNAFRLGENPEGDLRKQHVCLL